MSHPSFTGRQRRRKTSAWVRFSEVASRVLITIGGIGTIAAVTTIFVFLVWVVVPLFQSGELQAAGSAPLEAGGSEQEAPLLFTVDEYQLLSAVLHADGRIRVHRLDDGSLLQELEAFSDGAPTAVSKSIEGSDAAFGFANGTVRTGSFGFSARFPRNLEDSFAELAEGEVAVHEGGLVEHMPNGQLRLQQFKLSLEDSIEIASGERIVRIDHATGDDETRFVAQTETGRLALHSVTAEEDLFTGELTLASESTELELSHADLPTDLGAPEHVLLSGTGDGVLVVWKDGRLARFDTRFIDETSLAEVTDLLPQDGETITSLSFMIGKTTLVTGDSEGRLTGWFNVRQNEEAPDRNEDGQSWTQAHQIQSATSAITHISPSPRTRLLAAGHADGTTAVVHLTAASRIAASRLAENSGVLYGLQVSPKEDGLFALTSTGVQRFELDPEHPEASLATLFAPVWYEGYEEPTHSWQSSSGTDDFEPKLGLTPLVYGTLKATFYSMLFGVPLALLAAIYTSEFLDRRLRSPIKSSIEMMASLPSVVLGFLAALFIAPLIQDVVPETLASFLTIPFCFLLGAFLWQLMPARLYLRMQGWPRLAAIFLAIPIGLLLATGFGPVPGMGAILEDTLFAGDIFLWLDGQRGGPLGGWLFLMLPASGFLVFLLANRFVAPILRRSKAGATRRGAAMLELGKFAGICTASILVALALSALLGTFWDPRGSFVGTYVQRNALIVGFVMGFAIIPIIYTLSEDALSSVPEHLRLASLGAGATPWQTAVRVIVPTAASGLFSAMMIGLGRAVGETMIVLMATGNTAVMEWNIFNGFRTLSANIAVELPEAVKGSTHYRMLFLAAFVLFALTFVLNTLAEVVRQRFRKRAYQL